MGGSGGDGGSSKAEKGRKGPYEVQSTRWCRHSGRDISNKWFSEDVLEKMKRMKLRWFGGSFLVEAVAVLRKKAKRGRSLVKGYQGGAELCVKEK